MRLSNRSRIPIYNFVLTLINVLIVIGLAGFILEKTRLAMFGNESILFVLLPVLLLILFLMRGRQIFEYDSDGEAVNFKNRNIIPFLSKEIRDEFPKYKILSYEVVNAIFFKKLFVKIKSRKEHHQAIILKYDISYLTDKEIKDLKFSLKKIIKANKEANREGKTQG
ncbi:hypothetical protein [Cloacibacterium normanense]|uniref:Uncharacterized protein n=1 Tax=Cloacibacterium normanense TaxID=237258 RepID=A0A1E5UEE7_9FLAO|nr:hypothetical protein [Cloacibacterium normanense]AZI69063.1 hypothetical protein EB819_03880 [Cloacibacterium normanense]OEL11250.1 hypothetical protein BHF72_2119 [Cloacibacterium normanense]SDO12236.1 hypothetical protein SAMN04489756_1019 [Cloacibacterium normanense]